jgi:hypothetical protein
MGAKQSSQVQFSTRPVIALDSVRSALGGIDGRLLIEVTKLLTSEKLGPLTASCQR